MSTEPNEDRERRDGSSEKGGAEDDRSVEELKSGARGAGEAPGGTDAATGQVLDPEDEEEEASEGSFPASDPPAW